MKLDDLCRLLIPTMKPTDMPKVEKTEEKVEKTPVSAPVEKGRKD